MTVLNVYHNRLVTITLLIFSRPLQKILSVTKSFNRSKGKINVKRLFLWVNVKRFEVNVSKPDTWTDMVNCQKRTEQ
jgi:hypothetical protein